MTIYSVNCVLQLFVSHDCSITIFFLIITTNYFTGYRNITGYKPEHYWL